MSDSGDIAVAMYKDLKSWAKELNDELDKKDLDKTKKVVELTAWRTERHLRQFSFFALKASSKDALITYESNGVRTEVHGGAKGLPTVWDADILDFAISKAREICDSEADFPTGVRFSRRELLRAVGKNPSSGKNHKAIDDGLFRLASALILTKSVGDNGLSDVRTSHLITYRRAEFEGSDALIELEFSPGIVRSIRARNILSDDPETAQMLLSENSSGLRKQLLRLLSVRFGKTRQAPLVFWQDTLMDLCNYKGTPTKFRHLVRNYELPYRVALEKRANKRWQISFY